MLKFEIQGTESEPVAAADVRACPGHDMSRAHSSSLRHTATSHVAVTSNDSVITDMWLYFCKLQLCSARVCCLLVPCMYCNQAMTGVAVFLQPPPNQPTNQAFSKSHSTAANCEEQYHLLSSAAAAVYKLEIEAWLAFLAASLSSSTFVARNFIGSHPSASKIVRYHHMKDCLARL